MRITFLGTGTSRGVPVIGCQCAVCNSENPRNKRLRSSVLLESEVKVVIDTSADFRQQMLRQGVLRLDAAVFTHAHVDHILGLDDVYPFNIWNRRDFPIFASAETLREIEVTFRHLFAEERYPGIPVIQRNTIEGPFQIGDLNFEPIQVLHGSLAVLGFRIGSFAYLTDLSHIPAQSMEKLEGIEWLVLGALRSKPHPTHFSLSQAAEAAMKIGASQTYLIHMCHEVEHQQVNADLPKGVELSYDGLVLEI